MEFLRAHLPGRMGGVKMQGPLYARTQYRCLEYNLYQLVLFLLFTLQINQVDPLQFLFVVVIWTPFKCYIYPPCQDTMYSLIAVFVNRIFAYQI